MLLTEKECRSLVGKGITAGSLIVYMGITALGAAILKILFSSRGKVSVAGIQLSCGK